MHPTWHFFGEDDVEADDEEEEDNDDSWDTIFSDKPILSSVKSGNLDLLDSANWPGSGSLSRFCFHLLQRPCIARSLENWCLDRLPDLIWFLTFQKVHHQFPYDATLPFCRIPHFAPYPPYFHTRTNHDIIVYISLVASMKLLVSYHYIPYIYIYISKTTGIRYVYIYMHSVYPLFYLFLCWNQSWWHVLPYPCRLILRAKAATQELHQEVAGRIGRFSYENYGDLHLYVKLPEGEV